MVLKDGSDGFYPWGTRRTGYRLNAKEAVGVNRTWTTALLASFALLVLVVQDHFSVASLVTLLTAGICFGIGYALWVRRIVAGHRTLGPSQEGGFAESLAAKYPKKTATALAIGSFGFALAGAFSLSSARTGEVRWISCVAIVLFGLASVIFLATLVRGPKRNG